MVTPLYGVNQIQMKLKDILVMSHGGREFKCIKRSCKGIPKHGLLRQVVS